MKQSKYTAGLSNLELEQIKEKFAKVIQDLLIRENLTEEQLAQILCVTVKTIYNYKSGLNIPSEFVMLKLMTTFDIDLRCLVHTQYQSKQETIGITHLNCEMLNQYTDNKDFTLSVSISRKEK